MPQQQPKKRVSLLQRLLSWANAPCTSNSAAKKKLHSFTRIILITVKEFTTNELNIRASALTYTILLSLVPMLAMSTAVLKGIGGSDQLRTMAYSYIDTLDKTTPLTTGGLSRLPVNLDVPTTDEDQSITSQFRSVADQIFNYVDNTNFATLGTIGVLGVLFSAILVLSNIELAMNEIWHVPSGRSFFRKITDYLTLLILMPISINLGFVANTVLKNDTILNKIMSFFPGSLVQAVLLLLVPLFFITLSMFLIYIFFPNTKVKPGSALIGACFAATLWFITQNLYIGLQIGVSKYNAIYGSFATLPLFLIWMFLGWVFILGGAQLAFACQRQNSYQLKKLKHSPMEQVSAAFDILAVIYNSYREKSILQKKDLSYHCPSYSALLLLETTNKLIAGQVIEISKQERLLPGAPATQMHYKEVLKAILGDSFPSTEGGQITSGLFKQIHPVVSQCIFANDGSISSSKNN